MEVDGRWLLFNWVIKMLIFGGVYDIVCFCKWQSYKSPKCIAPSRATSLKKRIDVRLVTYESIQLDWNLADYQTCHEKCKTKKTCDLTRIGASVGFRNPGILVFSLACRDWYPPKTNMPMENHHFNRRYIFKWLVFRCHVSFLGCRCMQDLNEARFTNDMFP